MCVCCTSGHCTLILLNYMTKIKMRDNIVILLEGACGHALIVHLCIIITLYGYLTLQNFLVKINDTLSHLFLKNSKYLIHIKIFMKM